MIGNYREVRIIKSSPFGCSEVLEIEDTKTLKHYVLKIIKGISTPLYNVIFEREVGALNRLRMCNSIVRMEHYDTIEYKRFGNCGAVFLEYIEGETLDEMDTNNISTSIKYNIISQIIDAVQAAHENSIIHRDINPKNIMITNDYQVKLIDFGISKIKDMVNEDTLFQFATNKYAAPEVHNHSENATEQSDIYSMGAVFYYILTGETPPLPDELDDKLKSIGGIDIDMKQIISLMVKSKQSERFQDVFQVKKSICKILNRFTKQDKTYIFSITTNKINYMRDLTLVPRDGTYEQIIQEHICENFLESYIFIENENKADEKFILYGHHYFFECLYDDSSEIFDVNKVKKTTPVQREDIKRKALHVNGDVVFTLSGRGIPRNNNYELNIKVRDSKKEYLSSQNVNNEYSRNFSVWHKFLEIMEQEYKNNVIKIQYDDYIVDGYFLVFTIREAYY